MDLLQINKFGDLHDGKHLHFCRTDNIQAEFKKIKKLKHDIVLISGNSDKGIKKDDTVKMPSNIFRWYCQNLLTDHPVLRPIPLGLENTFISKRKGHGIGWPHAEEKIKILNDTFLNGAVNPSKFIYSNFNEQTNAEHRTPIKELSKKAGHIDWEDPSLNYQNFINSVLDHEAVICPAGNGLDTHRLYEILYCKRVAITIKMSDSPLYREIYEKLPVIILEDIDELKDVNRLLKLVDIVKNKPYDQRILDFKYWNDLIKASVPLSKSKSNFFSKVLHSYLPNKN